MPGRRYTILVADRTSGVVRRVTIPLRPAAITACVALMTPILIGFGAAWKGRHDVADLQSSHQALQIENANYRAATDALAGQIESLQSAIADLGVRSALDPNLAKAMNKLPALVKARAMGGTAVNSTAATPGSKDLKRACTSSSATWNAETRSPRRRRPCGRRTAGSPRRWVHGVIR